MQKVIKDGEVAVLISPGFGAGWSTWNSSYRDVLLFDADIVNAVLAGDLALAETLAAEKAPDAYLGGAGDLVVEWLPEGTVFEVNEYDGSESIHQIGGREYAIA